MKTGAGGGGRTEDARLQCRSGAHSPQRADLFEAGIFTTTCKRYFFSVIAFAGPVFTPYLAS
jgi:hypothetical protein